MSNQNHLLIQQFYQSFADHNVQGILDCYHPDITFEDPAFGELHGAEARSMWRMLLGRGGKNLKVTFDNVQADKETGSANWTARYEYQGRPVVNEISARFKFKDGKIFDHRDEFDVWKWSRQALGISGYLLGWSDFMKKKIQASTHSQLAAFVLKRKS